MSEKQFEKGELSITKKMKNKRWALTRLTVDQKQKDDCINYRGFGAEESLSKVTDEMIQDGRVR